MNPLTKKGTCIFWGIATKDCRLVDTKNGRHVASFSIRYDRHHNEDGQAVNEYINVSCWDPCASFIGDPDIGIARGDWVVVFGQLVEDTYYAEGEDKSVEKWKVMADIVLDMTSIFQVAQMVVNGEMPTAPATNAEPKTPPFSETDEETPFALEQKRLEETGTMLPY